MTKKATTDDGDGDNVVVSLTYKSYGVEFHIVDGFETLCLSVE